MRCAAGLVRSGRRPCVHWPARGPTFRAPPKSGASVLFDAFESKGAARLAAWLELTGETRRFALVRDAVRRVGIHWATEQCRDLLDHNVRGIHFYTLNQDQASLGILKALGLGRLS